MRSIYIKILSLLFCCGIGLGTPAQNTQKKKVAVYMTGDDVQESYKKIIGSKLVNTITQSGEYAAVERTNEFLKALTTETDYQTSGEVRDSDIARIGQKFGVKYVVVADVSDVYDELYISSRLIDVETGLVNEAYDVNGPAENMRQLISLSEDVADGLLILPQRRGQEESAKSMLDGEELREISSSYDLEPLFRGQWHIWPIESNIKLNPSLKNYLKFPIIIGTDGHESSYSIDGSYNKYETIDGKVKLLNSDGSISTIKCVFEEKTSSNGEKSLIKNQPIKAYIYLHK